MRMGVGTVPEDVFEVYADDYDRWFDEHQDEYHGELSRIWQILPPPDSHSIEVGVGSGRFASPLRIGIGVEPSLALCRAARRRGIDVIRGKAEALPIRDGSCSSLLFATVICFLDDPVAALRDIHRVLITGGVLIIAFIERDGEIERRYLQKGGKGRFFSRARFYSQDEVRRFLEGTGFAVREIDSRGGFCLFAAQKI